MSTTIKKLGQRQLAVLGHLALNGPTDLDAITQVMFGTPYRRGEARKSIRLLEQRGLVSIERDEQGAIRSVSLVMT